MKRLPSSDLAALVLALLAVVLCFTAALTNDRVSTSAGGVAVLLIILAAALRMQGVVRSRLRRDAARRH